MHYRYVESGVLLILRVLSEMGEYYSSLCVLLFMFQKCYILYMPQLCDNSCFTNILMSVMIKSLLRFPFFHSAGSIADVQAN